MHNLLLHFTIKKQGLFKQVSPDANGMEMNAACRDLFTNCPPSRTADIALEYARNNTKWHKDFGPAFQILIEHGYTSNQLMEAVEEQGAATSIKVVLPLLVVGATIASIFQ